MTNQSKLIHFLVVGALLAALVLSASVPASAKSQVQSLDPDTQFYVPKPQHGARQQIGNLISTGNKDEAELIRTMIETPQAVWLTAGTPHQVQQEVRQTVQRAAAKDTVPVLVAYNLPFRDCAQYSAGGATSVAEYKAWIDGFAAGIGNTTAVVILEPDGLGIIPWYNPFGDRDTWTTNPNYEWCQPAEADPATAAAERFEMLNYAVDKLKENAGTSVYLDATHNGWLGAGDAADRLYQAGVLDADGFFLNVSNFRLTEHLVKYGSWVAKCIWFGDPGSGSWGAGHFEWCASQYSSPFGPVDPNDFSTWVYTDQWYANNVENQSWVPYPGDAGLKHFVIDTSRNGQGPWTPAVSYPSPEDWCNPPDRGLGLLPTADTGFELVDAYLWIKIPGASDGECTRGLGPAGETIDPEWGVIDPAAGAWFPEMALDLVQNANPPLP
ncbi:MAG: glycoside hydrolase family 6 protein [Anaerolineales bacterium]